MREVIIFATLHEMIYPDKIMYKQNVMCVLGEGGVTEQASLPEPQEVHASFLLIVIYFIFLRYSNKIY